MRERNSVILFAEVPENQRWLKIYSFLALNLSFWLHTVAVQFKLIRNSLDSNFCEIFEIRIAELLIIKAESFALKR